MRSVTVSDDPLGTVSGVVSFLTRTSGGFFGEEKGLVSKPVTVRLNPAAWGQLKALAERGSLTHSRTARMLLEAAISEAYASIEDVPEAQLHLEDLEPVGEEQE
jgi:hypothetical protein